MTESFFLLSAADALKRMESTEFASEDVLQDLLARFPQLLTDADFGEATQRRWLLVTREAAVSDSEEGSGRWSLDHLFLDQDGVPTLVEIKRAIDTRARREVVAQMLDYAANAVSWWRIDDLTKWFAARCEKDGVSPVDRLGILLETDSPDEEAFWRSVQANLGSGRIRMVFLADRIAPELERIVEFLNGQMNPATVVAVELRHFASGSDRILAPRLIGITSRATAQKSIVRPTVAESVEEWLETRLVSTPSTKDAVDRFVGAMAGRGITCTVANKSLALDYTQSKTPIRFAYIRPNGKVVLSCYMLAKVDTFKRNCSPPIAV